MLQAIIRRGRVRPILAGHPWIMSGSVARYDGYPQTGDVVRLVAEEGQPLGWALHSSSPNLPLRTLAPGLQPERHLDGPRLTEAYWRDAISAAATRRQRWGLPAADTTTWRLLNSEGDHTPGVTCDVFADRAALRVSTAAAWAYRDALVSALKASVPSLTGVAVGVDTAMLQLEGVRDALPFSDGETGAVEVCERGMRLLVSPDSGQKTGHYCDQREQRLQLGRLASGMRVLDAYSFCGGFALQAALHGAASVVAVDSSRPAIHALEHNARLNGVEARVEARCGRVEDVLRSLADRDQRFDLISLDPPAIAPSARHVDKALRKLEALVLDTLRVAAPDATLVVSSCSRAIDAELLLRLVGSAAGRIGRHARLEHVMHQPPDHPVPAAMAEGRYLTGAWFHIA